MREVTRNLGSQAYRMHVHWAWQVGTILSTPLKMDLQSDRDFLACEFISITNFTKAYIL